MNEKKKARVKLMLAMILFGTLAPFVRNISLGSGELALYRAILAAILLGAYLALGKRDSGSGDLARAEKENKERQAGKRDLVLLLLSGAALGVNWILLFEAYKYTTVSIATISYYFAPVIVMVVCPFLFHEKVTAKQILCFVMSTVGLVLIIGVNGTDAQASQMKGILFGLGAAVFYAAVMILNKYIQSVTGIQRTIYQFLAAVIVLLPYVLVGEGIHLSSLDMIGLVCLLIVGFVHTGVTYCLYFSALKDLRGQEAAILSYIDPLVAILVSVLILGEGMSVLQGIGGALILGFTLWNEKSAS